MLVDSNGSPAFAPVGLAVRLASSRTDIASVDSSVVISPGQSYGLTGLVTTLAPGEANFTASSSGYKTSSTIVSTISPAPSRLAIYVSPSGTIQSVGRKEALLVVQLQDSTGLPARARRDTSIIITASDTTLLGKPSQLMVRTGEDYAFTSLSESNAGSGVLTASASGLISSSTTFSVLPTPLLVNLAASSGPVTQGAPSLIRLTVQFLGAPVNGASVTFSSTLGQTSPSTGFTDQSGQLTTIFMSQQPGLAMVTASVSQALLGNRSVSVSVPITVIAAGPLNGLSPLTGVFSLLPLSYLPLLIFAVVLVILIFGARRTLRKRRNALEENDDGESQQPPKT
jgi:hypothetical protein